MKMKSDLEYLGDGLYVSFDGYIIKLMTNIPDAPTDTVYLDPAVLEAFMQYVTRIKSWEK